MNKTAVASIAAVAGLTVGILGASLVGGSDSKSSTSLTDLGDGIVATVGGDDIMQDELYDFMFKMIGEEAVVQLVQKEVVEKEAKDRGIKVDKKDVEAELLSMEEDYGGKEMLEMQLAQNGRTMDDLREDVKNYLLLTAVLESYIDITEEDLKEYFEENKEELAQPEQVQARHILVETEEEARTLQGRIDNGESFEDMAKEFSLDESNAEQGGDLGYFASVDMVEEFSEVAFNLEVGVVSDPVKTDFGFHLILVEDKKEAEEADFEELREFLEEDLMASKLQDQYAVWLDETKEKYNVKTVFDTEEDDVEVDADADVEGAEPEVEDAESEVEEGEED